MHMTNANCIGRQNLEKNLRTDLQKYWRWFFLSLNVGLIAGLSSSIFLYSLNWVWQFQMRHHETLFAIPIAILVIHYFYHKYAKEKSDFGALVLEEIHDPQTLIPAHVAPLVFFGTLLSHLVGGSVGREGSIVQVSASLTDQFSRFFNINASERKILLIAGSGAGFGAAVGAPVAGIIFGMEMIYIGRLKIFAPIQCMIASSIAFAVSILLKAPHIHLAKLSSIAFDPANLFWILFVGALCGIVARLFIFTHHRFLDFLKSIRLPAIAIQVLGGLILCGLFYYESSFRFNSLRIDEIQMALQNQVGFSASLYKFCFTILSLSFGLKGGEFIPLVFIGSHFGSALSQLIPLSVPLLASVGYVAVYAGAANVPITSTIMAVELFGWAIAPYALLACLASYYFSGQSSLNRQQKRRTEHKLSPLFEFYKDLKIKFFN
jgi:H+/Cl- antiporter ClcA